MQITKPVKAPRKQRKQLYTAPAHLRHKFMAAPLSPELAASKGVKALPVRKGDTVQVTRGDHKGFEGKVSRVDLAKRRIFIEGLTREKVDGTTIFIPVHPSKVMIKNLKLDDKWRQSVVERKSQAKPKKERLQKKVEKLPEKPAAVAKAEPVAKEPEVAAPEEPVEKPSGKKAEVKPKVTRKASAAKKAKEEPTAEKKASAKKTAVKSEEKLAEEEEDSEKVKSSAKPKRRASTKQGGA